MKAGVFNNIALRPSDLASGDSTSTNKIEPNSGGSDFLSCLKDALHEVDDLQKEAAASGQKLALGDQEYLHDTVIAYEKANLALQLTIEVRNKIVESFQELMRIQM
ncbi:flagellar hook-basal body complex protein FliE [Syntrophomonas palmitatica]|uniref:flagellar hook-basal body complex protein FliE n=1 Tax=Syntrophomonas palmitatica TaxID=402877 RepID=UPI0006D02545|nr:flagellar hook-basal body complex protein FliE [Syntrophomonas palmitatica]